MPAADYVQFMRRLTVNVADAQAKPQWKANSFASAAIAALIVVGAYLGDRATQCDRQNSC